MKSIIICGLCDKPKKFSSSYELKVLNYSLTHTTDPLFGRSTNIRACKSCVHKIGYKTKTDDKRKENKKLGKSKGRPKKEVLAS